MGRKKQEQVQPRTLQEIQLLKEIWALMIENGRILLPEHKWSYYGGGYSVEIPDGKHHYKIATPYDIVLLKKPFQDKIDNLKEIGVDWEKTNPPELDWHSEFVGTGDEPNRKSVWEGKLILKDGFEINFYLLDSDTRPRVQSRVSDFERAKTAGPTEDLVAKFFD